MKIASRPPLVLLTISFALLNLCVLGQSRMHALIPPSQNTEPLSSTPKAEGPVAIHVDLTRTIGSYTPLYSWFGCDESNHTTMKYGKQLLGELHDLSPVPVYVRAHWPARCFIPVDC